MAVATRLFAQRGYDAVGVQEIVENADLTKPTLYHYFGSKRGLLEGTLGVVWQELRDRLEGALSYAGDLPHTLESAIGAFLRFSVGHPAETRLFVALSQAPPESEGRSTIRPFQDEFTGMIRHVFERAVEQHGNMRGRESTYTASFVGTLFVYAILLIDGELSLTDDLPYRIMHQFSYGIYS